ncbi:kinase-like protein [Gigaspora margarita]|uniref:Kinase-like protein n=1 Tax=Gigaspora margarita TaxID=4874 RepID=A0A8H3XBS2_GIGMA|nr:kinase-like protein [Gigaspora margarita]
MDKQVHSPNQKSIKEFCYTDFSNIRIIGRGKHGTVCSANLGNLMVVLKRFNNIKALDKNYELSIKRAKTHPNIRLFLGITKDPVKDYLITISEYANDNLQDYLRNKRNDDGIFKISFDNLIQIANEITSGLEWLHFNDIIHRNLHSKNILIHKDQVKISDFDLNDSFQLSNSVIQDFPAYYEPQLFINSDKVYLIDKKSDIYSLGVVFWELTSGITPFSNCSKYVIIMKIANGKREETIPNTPIEYVNIYTKCWRTDPNERPTLHDIKAALDELPATSSVEFIINDTVSKPPMPFIRENNGRLAREDKEKNIYQKSNKGLQIMHSIGPVLYSIRADDDGDCFILKLDETNNWQIDNGPVHSPSYQYFKSAILKRKITNFKGIIITNLSNGEFEDLKSIKLLNWNSTEKTVIERISSIFKNIPEQPINKISESYIKLLIKDKQLWLSVNEKGELVPSDMPTLFRISNESFPDQIAYRISICNFDFIVKFEWVAKNKYDEFYLVDLNTGKDLYYAFEESTLLPHLKKQSTKERALLFNFSKDNSTNQSVEIKKSGNTLRSFLIELGEQNTHASLTIMNALNYIIRACNVKKVFKSFIYTCLQLQANLDSEIEWEITKYNLFNIKNAIIKLEKSELPKLHSYFPFYEHATDMQVIIKNSQLDDLKIEISLNLNNNGSTSCCSWDPDILDIFQTKSVYDYLLNANVPQHEWKDLTLGYLSLLIMPPLKAVPEYLKIPLPFLSGISLLDQKINKEISDINFEIGPTGARLIQAELFLDTLTENEVKFDGIQISQLSDIKITIINSDVVNGDLNIALEACANIKDNIVKILTKNENDQFLAAKFNTDTTLANIAIVLNVDEKVYNELKVPLYDIPLDNFLIDVNPEFNLLFCPVTKPPTMNFRLKSINIFANNFPKMEKFMPPQFYQTLNLTNISIDISVCDPLDIENTMIGLNIKSNLLTTDNKKLLANLSYHPIKSIEQHMLMSIKPQDTYDNDNPLNLKEMLKAIGLYDTIEKINEVAPMLWHHVKVLESVEFQYLVLQIKLNEQNNAYEIGDFNLGILIPRFIIKKDVIEIRNAILDLGYNGIQWSGNIQGATEIIGKDGKYSCLIDYLSPTKEQLGNLLIKNLNKCFTLKEIIQILELDKLESISTIPILEKLFESSEININLINSDHYDFIIQDLLVIFRTDKLELKPLIIGQSDKLEMKPLIINQSEVNISYFPPKNNTDSAMWKFSIRGNIDNMTATLNYNNEKHKIEATLIPDISKKLEDIIELLVEKPEFSDNSMYYEICDSEVANIELIFNIDEDNMYIEYFSTELMKTLSYDKFFLDNLLFIYEEMIHNDNPNKETPPRKKYTLESIISRKKDIHKVSAKMKIDCSKDIAEASITSVQNSLSLSNIFKFVVGFQYNLSDILPKLSNLPDFDNIEITETYSIKILIKPFKIIEFNISAEKKDAYDIFNIPAEKEDAYDIFNISAEKEDILETPSIRLQPIGISFNYVYDLDRKKEKFEGTFYGTFLLNDGTNLRLKFASSKTNGEDVFIASMQIINDESAVYFSSFIDTLLGGGNEWSNQTPEEMRSPKLIVENHLKPIVFDQPELILSTDAEVYLYINLTEKSVALYATINSIGNALLLVKKLNRNPSEDIMESLSNNSKLGYLLTLKTPNDFKFEEFFNHDIASNIDTILPLTQGNIVLVSYQDVTFESVKKDLNGKIKELNNILNPDDEDKKPIKFEDILSIKLPDRKDIYKPTLIQGANIYACLDYTKGHSILLENFSLISNLVSISPKILVELSLGTDSLLSNSEFRASIENLELDGGLNFEEISFSYIPNDKKFDPKLIFSGNLKFEKLLSTKFDIKGSLNVSEEESTFEVESLSQSIENPFGKMSGICIKEIVFKMKFKYGNNMAFSRKVQSIYSLKGKVGFHSENPNIETILEGNILFVNGIPRVCSVNIDQKIQLIHLLATIFSEKYLEETNLMWPKDFPDIAFNDGEIYYASIPTDYPEDSVMINNKVYDKGYNINSHIDFFGIVNPLITAQINNGIKIKVTENSEINLGYIKISINNLIVELNVKNYSIGINGCLKLFGMDPAEFHLNYKNKTQRFEGEIEIKGSLLGVDNPKIIGYWSKMNKFVITEWPSFCKLIWTTAELAKFIVEASSGLCGSISDLKLNENFEGHFNINLKQHETQNDTLVSFLIEGKYLLRITGGKEESTDIAEIDIPSIQFDIKYPICDDNIPICLLEYFENELLKNVVKSLQNLLKDSEKFAKFLDGLAIITLIKLSESALKGFVCFAGNEINKLAKDTLEAMKNCAKNILANKQPKNKKLIEEDVIPVEEALMLSDSVSLAGPLLAITGEWIAYFIFAINLVLVLKNLFGDQSEEEKEIKKGKGEMEGFEKRIKNAVERFLNLDYLIPGVEFYSDISLKIKWNIPKNAENDKSAGEIRYKLRIIIIENEIIEKDIIVGKKEIESDKSDHKRLSHVFENDLLMKCKNVSVTITAVLQHGNLNYTGLQSKEAKIEHTPKLYPPAKLKSIYNAHTKILTTEIVSDDNDTKQYYCELINTNVSNYDNNDDNKSIFYHEVIKIRTLKSTLLTINFKENLITGPGGEYKIRALAMSPNLKKSEFKYADEVISRLHPPISVEFNRTYDVNNNEEYLKITVKDIPDQQQLHGYTYQIINDKDIIYSLPTDKVSISLPDLRLDVIRNITKKLTAEHYIHLKKVANEEYNWMDSSYISSTKSFKFLSHVNNIKGFYNKNNNILNFYWDPVENASQYLVTLFALGQHLKQIDKIPKTFIEYDMQEFDEQLKNSDNSIITYICTIQAVNGKEFFDGPVNPINEGFIQLPRPTNVNMEKTLNKLHVYYTPITLSDDLKKDFKGYKINLYNIQSSNEHLVAESSLIEDVTSNYYDFPLDDIKFKENGIYRAKVYAISSNDQIISSFPGNSIKTMKRLLPPNNIQISVKTNESDIHMIISCGFDPEIKAYVLGVVNKETNKFISKFKEPTNDSPMVQQELSLAEIRKIHNSPKFAKFHAFAQSIGDKDEFDSIIVNSITVVTQFEAPKDISLVLENNEFLVSYFAPTEGFYEAQVVDDNNRDKSFGVIKNKSSVGKDIIIIQIADLEENMKYIARVKKIVHDKDPTKYMPSIWQFSNVITI